FTQPPDVGSLRAALRDHPVEQQTLLHQPREIGLQPSPERRPATTRHLYDRVGRIRRREGIIYSFLRRANASYRRGQHQLEGGDELAGGLAHAVKERDGLGHGGRSHEHGFNAAEAGLYLEGGGGDDPERAFRADEELLEVVAGVVLVQAPQVTQDLPVRKDYFQPHDERARHTVADDFYAAGIGRDGAANLAGTLRTDRQREEGADLADGGLEFVQYAAGFDDRHAVECVYLPDRLHQFEADHDLTAVLRGRRPRHQPGVATL